MGLYYLFIINTLYLYKTSQDLFSIYCGPLRAIYIYIYIYILFLYNITADQYHYIVR